MKRFLVDGNERERDVCVRKSRVEFVSSKDRERERESPVLLLK